MHVRKHIAISGGINLVVIIIIIILIIMAAPRL